MANKILDMTQTGKDSWEYFGQAMEWLDDGSPFPYVELAIQTEAEKSFNHLESNLSREVKTEKREMLFLPAPKTVEVKLFNFNHFLTTDNWLKVKKALAFIVQMIFLNVAAFFIAQESYKHLLASPPPPVVMQMDTKPLYQRENFQKIGQPVRRSDLLLLHPDGNTEVLTSNDTDTDYFRQPMRRSDSVLLRLDGSRQVLTSNDTDTDNQRRIGLTYEVNGSIGREISCNKRTQANPEGDVLKRTGQIIEQPVEVELTPVGFFQQLAEIVYNADVYLKNKNVFLQAYLFSEEQLYNTWTFKAKAHLWPSHKLSFLLFNDNILFDVFGMQRAAEIGVSLNLETRVKHPSAREGLRYSTYIRHGVTVFANTWTKSTTIRSEATYNMTENKLTLITGFCTPTIKQTLIIHQKNNQCNDLESANPGIEKVPYRFGKIQAPIVCDSPRPEVKPLPLTSIINSRMAPFAMMTQDPQSSYPQPSAIAAVEPTRDGSRDEPSIKRSHAVRQKTTPKAITKKADFEKNKMAAKKKEKRIQNIHEANHKRSLWLAVVAVGSTCLLFIKKVREHPVLQQVAVYTAIGSASVCGAQIITPPLIQVGTTTAIETMLLHLQSSITIFNMAMGASIILLLASAYAKFQEAEAIRKKTKQLTNPNPDLPNPGDETGGIQKPQTPDPKPKPPRPPKTGLQKSRQLFRIFKSRVNKVVKF